MHNLCDFNIGTQSWDWNAISGSWECATLSQDCAELTYVRSIQWKKLSPNFPSCILFTSPFPALVHVPTSIILEQSETRIIFSWAVVSLFSVWPRYWSSDLYNALRIDESKLKEGTTTIHKLQHWLIRTYRLVSVSRVGQAKLILCIRACITCNLPIPVSSPPCSLNPLTVGE